MESKDGGPAFPGYVRNSQKKLTRHAGMTLRDWFAGQALAGMMANCDSTSLNGWIGSEETLAEYAYKAADAMLEERT